MKTCQKCRKFKPDEEFDDVFQLCDDCISTLIEEEAKDQAVFNRQKMKCIVCGKRFGDGQITISEFNGFQIAAHPECVLEIQTGHFEIQRIISDK